MNHREESIINCAKNGHAIIKIFEQNFFPIRFQTKISRISTKPTLLKFLMKIKKSITPSHIANHHRKLERLEKQEAKLLNSEAESQWLYTYFPLIHRTNTIQRESKTTSIITDSKRLCRYPPVPSESY